jgi:glycosyltransferase involved in cell wall biosynthesis
MEIASPGTDKKLQVIYLGLNEFPFGLAETQRARLIALGLVENGCEVTVVSRCWSAEDWDEASGLPAKGYSQGIGYVNTSGALTRPGSWVERKVRRFGGLVREAGLVLRRGWTGRLDAAILSTGSYWRIFYYWILSRLAGFAIVLNKAEQHTSTIRNPNALKRVNAFLLDHHAPKLADGVIPISSFLVDETKKIAPGKPWLKVPILVDRARFDGLVRSPECTYFLFAGYLAYLGIVTFILRAFDSCRSEKAAYLYLVVNGSAEEFAQLNQEIASCRKKEFIKVYSKLTDRELSQLYINAYALFIPLRQTVQDTARFPHKIGEYCASGRPMVTTNVGEVRDYFKNRETAFVVQNFDEQEYARAIEEVMDDPALADRVGGEAMRLAGRTFHYQVYGRQVREFIEHLVKRS